MIFKLKKNKSLLSINLLITFLISLLSLSTLIYSFTSCNVNFQEPYFQIKDTNKNSILIIDNQGNSFMLGTSHTEQNYNQLQSLYLSNNLYFNNKTSKFTSYWQNQNNLNQNTITNSLIIKNKQNTTLATLSKTGEIKTKGYGVYQNSQANCPNDGYYCNEQIKENRDYFCNIIGSELGLCTYKILSSENCLTKTSYDSDTSNNEFVKGFLYDYIDCNLGECTYNTYPDSCINSNLVRDYYPSSNSFSTITQDCTDNNYYFCSGLRRYKKAFSCADGRCISNNIFVEHCNFAPQTSETWSCKDSKTRQRTRVYYSNTCNQGSCGVSSYSSTSQFSCPSGTECSLGYCACKPDWGPSSSNYCQGTYFTQSDGCGGTRRVQGTKYCQPPLDCSKVTFKARANTVRELGCPSYSGQWCHIGSQRYKTHSCTSSSVFITCEDQGYKRGNTCYAKTNNKRDGSYINLGCNIRFYAKAHVSSCPVSRNYNWCSRPGQRYITHSCSGNILKITCSEVGNKHPRSGICSGIVSGHRNYQEIWI